MFRLDSISRYFFWICKFLKLSKDLKTVSKTHMESDWRRHRTSISDCYMLSPRHMCTYPYSQKHLHSMSTRLRGSVGPRQNCRVTVPQLLVTCSYGFIGSSPRKPCPKVKPAYGAQLSEFGPLQASQRSSGGQDCSTLLISSSLAYISASLWKTQS